MSAAPNRAAATISGRWRFLTPSRVMSAMMPPSPSLSMRMATLTYFTVVTMNSVHRISDRAPSVAAGSGMRPGVVEHGLERVEWARADVAEHHPERREAGEPQVRARLRPGAGCFDRHLALP